MCLVSSNPKSSVSWRLLSFLIAFSIPTALVVPLQTKYACKISRPSAWMSCPWPWTLRASRTTTTTSGRKDFSSEWGRHHWSSCNHLLPCLLETTSRVSLTSHPSLYSEGPPDIGGMSGSWTIQHRGQVKRNSCHHSMGMSILRKTMLSLIYYFLYLCLHYFYSYNLMLQSCLTGWTGLQPPCPQAT